MNLKALKTEIFQGGSFWQYEVWQKRQRRKSPVSRLWGAFGQYSNGYPRGDKGRIETSLVPPWRQIEKKLTHLIKLLTPT